MLSFHNDPKLKQKVLNQLKAHYKADEIIKGIYWERGKGSAMGCTVHSSKYSDYEDILDIPVFLGVLEDDIFEDLDNKSAKEFPIQFIEAIPVGVDLSGVYYKWTVRLLKRVRVYADNDGKVTIDMVIEIFEKGKEGISNAARAISRAVHAAAINTTTAVYVAAYAIDVAVYAGDPEYADYAAVHNAAHAAAITAAHAARVAHADAEYAAKTERIKQRDDLLELLKETDNDN